MEPLAHSGRASQGLGPQTYAAHVTAVRELAVANMSAALRYHTTHAPALESAINWAALFHDLGKLDSANQKVLRSNQRGALPVNHVDAGVAHLSMARQVDAAIAVYGHHMGLCDLIEEQRKQQLSAGDPACAPLRDYELKLANDATLPTLLALHRETIPHSPAAGPSFCSRLSGLDRRLLLSCLVDADHGDTARFYGNEPERNPVATRWEERLAALDAHVAGLGKR